MWKAPALTKLTCILVVVAAVEAGLTPNDSAIVMLALCVVMLAGAIALNI